jgi:hypothetical protein
METLPGDPDRLSRLELISLYINEYYRLDAGLRARFEAAFRKRKLPLPRIPASGPPPERPAVIDQRCFLSYILLIYSGTAIFYSWFYLAARLARMDFRENPKHRLIQSGIALIYVVAELLLLDLLPGAD